MIELKRLAPGILLGATMATLGLSTAVIVGAALLSSSTHCESTTVVYTPPPSPSLDEDDCDDFADRPEFVFSTAIDLGDAHCTGKAIDLYNAYQVEDPDLFTKGVDLLDCYEQVDDKNAAFNVSSALIDVFPENSYFYGRHGTYIIQDRPAEAADLLQKALELSRNESLPAEERSMLHNNFAWALLHSPAPNLPAIEYHSRRALELEGRYASCNITHTRLVYEFLQAMQNQSPNDRDFSEWVSVREPYTDCLAQMQAPQSVDQVGQHVDKSYSYQVFSTFVMDGLTRSAIILDNDAIDYLSSTRRAIDTEGPEAFCLEAMGTSDPRIQKACVDTASQMQLHWVTRDIIAQGFQGLPFDE